MQSADADIYIYDKLNTNVFMIGQHRCSLQLQMYQRQGSIDVVCSYKCIQIGQHRSSLLLQMYSRQGSIDVVCRYKCIYDRLAYLQSVVANVFKIWQHRCSLQMYLRQGSIDVVCDYKCIQDRVAWMQSVVTDIFRIG